MTVRLVLQYDSCGAKNLTIHSTRRADLLIRSTPRPYGRAVLLRKRLKKALSRPSNSACFPSCCFGYALVGRSRNRKGLTAASYFKKYPPFGRIFPWQGEKCGLAR